MLVGRGRRIGAERGEAVVAEPAWSIPSWRSAMSARSWNSVASASVRATGLAGGSDRAFFTARVDPRSTARVGAPLRLAVDPARLYVFEPSSGNSLVDRRVPSLA